MPPVTAFESNTPGKELARSVSDKFNYGLIEAALRVSLEAAGDVFARCAKFHLKDLLGDRGDKVRLADPVEPLCMPLWVVDSSVVVFFNRELDVRRIVDLTVAHASHVLKLVDNQVIRLGPLHTKVVELAEKMLKFSLRQKWGLDG